MIVGQVSAGAAATDDRITYNSISNSASSGVAESGYVYLTVSDMAAIAGATSVVVKVEGSIRSCTFEARDISKHFLPNVRTFFNEWVASRSAG